MAALPVLRSQRQMRCLPGQPKLRYALAIPAEQQGNAGAPAMLGLRLSLVDRHASPHFRYPFAIGRSGTRRSAALDLGVDHTTVSRRIRALEKNAGCPVNRARSSRLGVDRYGRSVAERARAIEESVQEAVDAAVGDSIDSLRGRVRVTAPDGFGTLVATPALCRLRMKHPHLSVELLTATRQMNLQQLGFDCRHSGWRDSQQSSGLRTDHSLLDGNLCR
jgi:DNA-binding transcriptional LysR family regulator